MGELDTPSEGGARTAARPRFASWAARWRALDRATAAAAARVFWSDAEVPEQARREAERLLAAQFRFRPQSIAVMPVARKAERLAGCRLLPERLAVPLLQTFHLQARQPLLARFLDLLGLEHAAGRIAESSAAKRCPPAALQAAITTLRREFPADEVELYLDCLELDGSGCFAGIVAARAAATPAVAPAPPAGAPTAAAQVSGAAPAAADDEAAAAADATPPTFTTLDRTVTQALVATLQEVEGALDHEQADDLVNELVALNLERHRSYFHRGFLDVLLGRSWHIDFAAANESRRGWYVAGAVLGHCRRSDDPGLLAELKRHQRTVDALLAGGGDWVRPLREPLFDVLWRAGRIADAIGLVSHGAVADHGPPFARRLLDHAAALLREKKTGDADRLLTALERALPELRRHPDHAALFELELGRRRAHCHRLRGDREQARTQLEALLGEEEGSVLSEVHADLGVLAAGYRSLAEVTLPREAADLKALAATLAPGERHFESAVRIGGERGHGEFLLGMLRYARGEAAAALPLLEMATARMNAQPETYRPLGTLRCAQLALADLLAATVDPVLVRRGCELLRGDRGPSAAPPDWLLRKVLESLALVAVDPDEVDALVKELLAERGPAVLDLMVAAGIASRSAAVIDALLRRSHGGDRQMTERFADARTALREAVARRDVARAEEALDRLELLADDEPIRSEFLALLETPDQYQPGFEIEEARAARIRLLVRAGRDAEAAALLAESFHKALADGDDAAMAAAEDVLAEIRRLGQGSVAETLGQRLTAARKAVGEEPVIDAAARSRVRLRVLFVGGNEMQARYDASIRAAIQQEWPKVELELRHTGWSSNWGSHLDWIQGALHRFDVVVLMTFVRTNLGRGVRKACSAHGIPWFSCTGHGLDSARRAIDGAIRLARAIADGRRS